MTKTTVKVLVTWDIDPTPEVAIEAKRQALACTHKLLADLRIASTFFFHARIGQDLRDEIVSLAGDGHEIGCHGLTHGDEEEYNRMPEPTQRAYLTEATEILSRIVNGAIRSFRGPRVKTSHTTQQILQELGYTADCSVASQRVDLVSSNLVNPGWVFAPRLPYHPSRTSAFRRGGRRIWVVPLSAMGVPFISSAMYVFRLTFMKRFFDVLYREALRTGKPIVYLAHPFEFAALGEIERPRLSIATIRTHGLLFRENFYVRDENRRIEMHRSLFKHIKSYDNVRFMTVGSFVGNVLEGNRRCGVGDKQVRCSH